MGQDIGITGIRGKSDLIPRKVVKGEYRFRVPIADEGLESPLLEPDPREIEDFGDLLPASPPLGNPAPPAADVLEALSGAPGTHPGDLLAAEDDVALGEGSVGLLYLDGDQVAPRCPEGKGGYRQEHDDGDCSKPDFFQSHGKTPLS